MIEAKDIVKIYNENTRKSNLVLDHADITFPDSGFVFIVGQSGIGKSTILNAIGGLIDYDGTILYDKKKVDIEKYRRKNIGYIFQDFLLFDDLSVRDNIKIGLNIAGIYNEKEISYRVNVLLKAVGLNINSKRSARALSLGQRQRVAIARALASNPKVILADEPTGNLDSKNSILVMKTLKKLSKDHLIICVTHNVNLVHLFADKAFAIVDKRFQEINPKAEALDKTYVTNTINISALSKKEMEDSNILFRIYSDDSDGKDEITIIRRGGKILVVGDNVALAKKEDISLVANKEESGKKSDILSEIEDDKLPDLNFENSEEKKHLKDSGFFKKLGLLFWSRLFGSRGKGKFLYKTAMTIPLLVYGSIAISSGIISSINEIISPTVNRYSNNLLVAVGNENAVKFTQDDFASLLSDPESHLIENQSSLNAYYETKNFIRPKADMNSEAVTLNLKDFSFIDKLANHTFNYFNNSKIETTFSVIDNYKTFVPELKDVNLQDDEIILDEFLFSNLKANNVLDFDSGDLRSNIKDTYFKINFDGDTIYTKGITYKIKDVLNTGLGTAFCTRNTFNRIALNHVFRYAEKAMTFIPFVPFYDYDVQDFSAIDESRYQFYKKDENGTEIPVLKSELNEDYYKNIEDGRVYEFDNSYEFLFSGYVSEEALNDSGIYFPSSTEASNYYRLGNLTTNDSYFVKDKQNPKNKVLVLSSYTDSQGKQIDSWKNYLTNMALMSVYYNSEEDDSLTDSDIAIPKELASSFIHDESKAAGFRRHLLFDAKFSSYDGKLNDKVKLSKNFFDKLRANYLEPTVIYGDENAGFGKNKVSICFDDYRLVFLSNDPEKSKAYVKEKYDFTLMDYNTARQIYINTNIKEILIPFIIVVVILLGIMVLIMVLQNVARINKEKYKFGVLRCLGKPVGSILLDDSIQCLFDFFFTCFVPSLLVTFLLIATHLFYMGWLYLLYLIVILICQYLSNELPLLLTLIRKPYQILRNLN